MYDHPVFLREDSRNTHDAERGHSRNRHICLITVYPNPNLIITLPLHGVAKTFKFRHRSFGVLALEN